MIRTVIFLLLLGHFFAANQAQASPILKCLGQEELLIHKQKVSGPLFKLNRHLINSFVNADQIRIKKIYLKGICHHPRFSPSLALLKALLEKKEKLFSLKRDNNSVLYRYQVPAMRRLIEEAPKILLDYLSGLQANMPTAYCLAEQMPALNSLLHRVYHLEDVTSFDIILKDGALTKEIFSHLKRIDQVYQVCLKKKQQAEAQRKSLSGPDADKK